MSTPAIGFPRRSIRAALLGMILAAAPAHAVLQLEGLHVPTGSQDTRSGSVAPSPAAVSLVQSQGWNASWNRFGTVHVLQKPGGFLATGLAGDAETAARAWISANRVLFRLSQPSVDALALERSVDLNQSNVHVLLFRQTAGGSAVGREGLIKIGLVEGKVFWVASSSIGDIGAPAVALITPLQAWQAAAEWNPLQPAVPAPTLLGTRGGWTLLDAAGYAGAQRVRASILGIPGAAAIAAFEANVVLDSAGGRTTAYTAFVNAANGQVVVVQDRVAQLGDLERDLAPANNKSKNPAARAKADRNETFTGTYPPDQSVVCGPCHVYNVIATDNFQRIVVTASSQNPANDIVLNLYKDSAGCTISSALLTHSDTATSPEVIAYEPGSRIPDGEYGVQVCPFSGSTQLPTTDYVGTISFQEAESVQATNPRWSQFPVTPSLDYSSVDSRMLACWYMTLGGQPIAECDDQVVDGSSHQITWDFQGSAPSQTTSGNSARSYEGWNAAIGGGSPYQPGPTANREYVYPWSNAWFAMKCDPSNINHAVPGANDIDAAVGNLFTLHNRLHDFAYHLGLREREGAAQTSNYGQTASSREGDAELGFAQAGGLNGGFPSYLGRDNANQVTLQDGVSPFSNMYLWQTIGGSIYVPCVDGDFDGQVIAHEFGHMVQNRLTDPDGGLSGDIGRAMGEGWSDLNAVMFFDELGFLSEADPTLFALGAYVIGDATRGIRNYSIGASPLNHSDIGYDVSCNSSLTNVEGTCESQSEVHSDGEIWTAVQYDIRAALVAKYDALGFSSSNATLKRDCANGKVTVDQCPGSRRWSQLIHDAMQLQPGAPSMIDARDAILAADTARGADTTHPWPSNQTQLWTAFARRGMGGARTLPPEMNPGPDIYNPIPHFDSELGGNASVHFDVRDLNGLPVLAQIYVGHYEARVSVAADTDPGTTAVSDTLAMVPGTYEFLVRADGYGHSRFSHVVAGPGPVDLAIRLAPNFASGGVGASASGAGTDRGKLIDETEATSWKSLNNVPSVDVATPAVTVALAGGAHVINRVQVSGMLEVEVGANLENRFSSIHKFALSTCNAQSANCSDDATYTQVFVSADGAFPSASLRPLAPDMSLREFRFNPVTATHVRLTALHNKCTGTPHYQGYLGTPGQEDNDPTSVTDCRVTNGNRPARTTDVRVAELEVFGADSVLLQADNLFADGFE